MLITSPEFKMLLKYKYTSIISEMHLKYLQNAPFKVLYYYRTLCSVFITNKYLLLQFVNMDTTLDTLCTTG